jgi:hypothetical protein
MSNCCDYCHETLATVVYQNDPHTWVYTIIHDSLSTVVVCHDCYSGLCSPVTGELDPEWELVNGVNFSDYYGGENEF